MTCDHVVSHMADLTLQLSITSSLQVFVCCKHFEIYLILNTCMRSTAQYNVIQYIVILNSLVPERKCL